MSRIAIAMKIQPLDEVEKERRFHSLTKAKSRKRIKERDEGRGVEEEDEEKERWRKMEKMGELRAIAAFNDSLKRHLKGKKGWAELYYFQLITSGLT